jgi:hypothetical protein
MGHLVNSYYRHECSTRVTISSGHLGVDFEASLFILASMGVVANETRLMLQLKHDSISFRFTSNEPIQLASERYNRTVCKF